MTILLFIICFILWCGYAMHQGWEEGMFLSAKYNCNIPLRKQDQHTFWTIQRTIVGSFVFVLFALYIYTSGISWFSALLYLINISVALVMTYPFFHDGMLYVSRNVYEDEDEGEPYPGGFFSNPDGPAIFDFRWVERLFLFCMGMIVYGITTHDVVYSKMTVWGNVGVTSLFVVILGGMFVYKYIKYKKSKIVKK